MSNSEKLEVGTDEWIKFVCTYQPATPDQMAHYLAINEGCQAMMRVIFEHVPPCADRSATIRLLREVRMMANAAIALKGLI